MFDVLASGFRKAREKIGSQTTLTEDNIAEALDLVRSSLLDADVEYNVAKKFLNRVKDRVIGREVTLRAGKGKRRRRASPADHFVRACKEELETLMGTEHDELTFPRGRPAIIMMVGLQGTGKTTTTGKLARYLRAERRRKPLLVAADVYRPAARQQLQILGNQLDIPVFSQESTDPVAICRAALNQATVDGRDTLLIDTAGRLTIDDKLMNELRDIKQQLQPTDIILVCDAMMGQDAVTTAINFHEPLNISAVVMTKLDGDARGGAALSIKEVTGVPIKFIGVGEGLEQLEKFRAEGLAGRILGLGDVVSLVEDIERVTEQKHEEDALRAMQGGFTLADFAEQLTVMKKLGSLKSIIDKMPIEGLPDNPEAHEKKLESFQIIISSMTREERLAPTIIDLSRISRIAKGCGRSEKEVNELLKHFQRMRSLFSKVGKNPGLLNKIPGVSQFNQIRQMQKMSKSEELQDLVNPPTTKKPKNTPKVDRNKIKKLRRATKNARRKNRR